MAFTNVKVIEIVQKYLQLQRELREFRDENYGWVPDEWVWRDSKSQEKYEEMEANFQNFQMDRIALDMEGPTYKNLKGI